MYKIITAFVIVTSSLGCGTSPVNQVSASFPAGTTLYCGHIRPGCEDVETDTLEIRFKAEGEVELIRMFHRSDLPLTSAFVGKWKSAGEIVGVYDQRLSEIHSRHKLSTFPAGKVSVSAECQDLSALRDCTVSGRALEGSISKFPGWEDQGVFSNHPSRLTCNTTEIKRFDAPECGEE